jgi:hypothetical protein
MPRGDPEQRERRALGKSPPLLPVAQSVDADGKGRCELLLGQTGESAKSDDVVSTGDLSSENPIPLLPGNRTGKLPLSQLRSVIARASSFRILHVFLVAALFAESHSIGMPPSEYTPLA